MKQIIVVLNDIDSIEYQEMEYQESIKKWTLNSF